MKAFSAALFMLISLQVWSATAIPAKKNDVVGGVIINETLQKLLDVPGVKKHYDVCVKDTTVAPKDLSDCIWKELDDKQKKAVQEAYAVELKTKSDTGRAPASAEVIMTAREQSVGTDYQSDPAVAALTKFYGTKLAEVLNPEKALTAAELKENKILSVDHRQFIDLYKSELGKTIVSAFTSYCLDTDPGTCSFTCNDAEVAACKADKNNCACRNDTCSISSTPSKMADHRKKNLEDLKKANLETNSNESNKWNMCIVSVGKSCQPDKNDETSKRACLIMDYVKSARKNIIMADEQKKFYDDLGKQQTIGIVSNTKAITDQKINSSEALLQMTSTDVTTALKDPMDKTKKEFEECFKDDKIVNAESCKKYLNTNTDQNNAAIAELGMRQLAQEDILKKELESDDKVKSYLKEEGYKPEEIENMLKDKANITTVRTEIMNRYKAQKQAIIAEMAAKISDKTSTTDGKVEVADISKLQKIRDELAARSGDLSNLVKFNNIVSSYLTIEGKSKGVTERNTASLFAESESTKDPNDQKVLKKQIQDAKLTDQKGSSSTVDVDVKVINTLFQYSAEKKD